MRRTGIAVVVALALGASACEGSTPSAALATPVEVSPTNTVDEPTSATEAPSASLTSTSQIGDLNIAWPFQVKGGYSVGFSVKPAEARQAAEARREDLADRLKDLSAGKTMIGASIVTQDGEPVAMLGHLWLTPAAQRLADQDPETALKDAIKGVIGSAGTSEFDVVTIAGQEVLTADGDTGVAYAWRHPKAIGVLLGEDPETLEAFLSAFFARAFG